MASLAVFDLHCRVVLTDVQVSVGRPTIRPHLDPATLQRRPSCPHSLTSLILSEFIGQDLPKSFWNGGGKVTILAKDIVDAIQTDPDLTIGALRARLTTDGRPLLVQTGLDFNIDAKDPL